MKLFIFILLLSSASFAFDGGDPLFDQQWHLENKGFDAREEITDIKSNLRIGVPGKDIDWRSVAGALKKRMKKRPSVAIVDTGIDYEHEDLAHSILLNEAECVDGDIPLDEATEDKDENGYKGDCKGIDLTTRDKLKVNRPLDDVGHGTHMAGIISAKWNNALGIAGVHEDIQILPIKAISNQESRQRVPLNTRVAQAIRYAVSRGVDVINLSVGYPIARDTQEMRDAVREAREAGVFLVAAAGNNAHSVPVYPCAYSEVICVGSTRNDGLRSEFSNRGAHVDVWAPGEFIISSFPMVEIPTFSAIKGYEVKSGTSQAAPIVSAALALLKSVQPAKSLSDLEQQLFRSLDERKNLSLKRLLDGAENPLSYRIKFKDFSVATVDNELKSFIPIEVQSLTSQSGTPNIKIRLKTPGYQIIQNRFNSGQLLVGLQATSLEVPHRVEMELKVGEQQQTVGFSLSRLVSTVSATQVLPVQSSEEVKNFGTIPALDGTSLGLYYAEVQRNSEPQGLLLKLWKRMGRQIQYVGQKVLEKSTGTLAIYQADVDADGDDDIMVLALGAEELEPDTQAVQVMHIHYLDSQLNPLFTDSGRIEKLGNPLFNFALFGEPRQTRWVYSSLGSGQKILTPMIVESGRVPEADQSKKEKRAGGSLKAKHIYYLNLIEDINGELQFETRVVDSADWRTQMRKKYRLRFYEDVEPELMLGTEAKVVVRLGQLEKSQYLLLEKSEGGWESTALEWPRALLGFRTTPIFDEVNGGKLTGLFGLISKSRMVALQLDPEDSSLFAEDVVIDLPDESEHIVRPLMLSRNQLGLKAVFESGQKLFGFHIQGGEVKKSFSQELPRTTFFGELLTQVNAIVQDQQDRPWVYVDDTQINANNLRFQSFHEEHGFQTMLRDSYSLDAACTPLNPARWNQGEAYRIQVLCRVEGKLELRSLPMQVNTH